MLQVQDLSPPASLFVIAACIDWLLCSVGPLGKHGSQHQRIVAVDCEMCYTRTALELTRLTLVGEDEQVHSHSLSLQPPCLSML